MGALPFAKLTVEEYLALDTGSERPLEYHDGKIFQMVDATISHAILQVNVGTALSNRLRGSTCIAGGQFRVRTTTRNYTVTNLSVVCGQIVTAAESINCITNPKLIVEILSPSTADFDHGGKFELYCQLATFEEYVLIAQDKPKVEVFTKKSETRWILTKYEGLHGTIRLESLNLEIPAAEIYNRVEFAVPDPDLT